VTPEEILQGLRDIHLPETAGSAASINLVLWPLALVLLAALAVLWLIRKRRSRWRRDYAADLDRIENIANTEGANEGWRQLAVLMKRLAMHGRARSDIAKLSGEPWLQRLDDLLGVDLFATGPGRGLATFPYLGAPLDKDVSGRMKTDLAATLSKLRTHYPGRGTAG
jgi:hypothetical protein